MSVPLSFSSSPIWPDFYVNKNYCSYFQFVNISSTRQIREFKKSNKFREFWFGQKHKSVLCLCVCISPVCALWELICIWLCLRSNVYFSCGSGFFFAATMSLECVCVRSLVYLRVRKKEIFKLNLHQNVHDEHAHKWQKVYLCMRWGLCTHTFRRSTIVVAVSAAVIVSFGFSCWINK